MTEEYEEYGDTEYGDTIHILYITMAGLDPATQRERQRAITFCAPTRADWVAALNAAMVILRGKAIQADSGTVVRLSLRLGVKIF